MRFALGVVFAACLAGQETPSLFEKAPPDVDLALRDRITKFYQAHMDGKFRQAEQYVAEDTKEFFYVNNKPKYLGFEIVRIEYSDNFTRAKATLMCEQIVPVLGFADKPMKVPTPSHWKLVDGKWFWFVDPESLKQTPFGRMIPGPDGDKGPQRIDMAHAPNVESLWKQVRVDKAAVQLDVNQDSAALVTLTNGMPGPITLLLEYPQSSGMQAALDRAEVKAGEKATVRFQLKANKARAGQTFLCRVIVQPTNQVIPIRVAFTEK